MTTGIEIVCGVVLLVFGLSYLINVRFWADSFKSLVNRPALVFPLLLPVLICGLLIVLNHNLWVADWRVLVTITGWAALVKSVVILLFPGTLAWYTNLREQTMLLLVRAGGLVWGGFGLYMTYMALLAQ